MTKTPADLCWGRRAVTTAYILLSILLQLPSESLIVLPYYLNFLPKGTKSIGQPSGLILQHSSKQIYSEASPTGSNRTYSLVWAFRMTICARLAAMATGRSCILSRLVPASKQQSLRKSEEAAGQLRFPLGVRVCLQTAHSAHLRPLAWLSFLTTCTFFMFRHFSLACKEDRMWTAIPNGSLRVRVFVL